MSSEAPDAPEGTPGDPNMFTQEIRHSQIGARVPEDVRKGVFSTGALVMQGPHEFVLDFCLRMAQPHQIVARVIMAPSFVPQFIRALQDNLNKYQQRFGPPPAMPQGPPPERPPSIEEIYDQLKLPDDLLSGVYANVVMIAHSPAEFCFDFITNFYPRPAVSCRVYLSSMQAPSLLNTLTRSFQQYQQKVAAMQAQQQQQRRQEPPPPQPNN